MARFCTCVSQVLTTMLEPIALPSKESYKCFEVVLQPNELPCTFDGELYGKVF